MQYVLKKTVFQRRTSFFVKTQLQMLLSDFIMKGIMRMRSGRRFLDIWMIQYAIKLIMILKIVKKNDDDNDDNGHLVEKDRGV